MNNVQPELRNVLSQGLTELFGMLLFGTMPNYSDEDLQKHEGKLAYEDPAPVEAAYDIFQGSVMVRAYADWQIFGDDDLDVEEYVRSGFETIASNVTDINVITGLGLWYVHFTTEVRVAKDCTTDAEEMRAVIEKHLNEAVGDTDVKVRFAQIMESKDFTPIVEANDNLSSDEALAALREKLTGETPFVDAYSPCDIGECEFCNHVEAEEAEKNEREVNTVDHNPGKHLCYDDWSGRYFYGSKVFLEVAEAKAKAYLADEGDLDLNTVYDLLGLPPLPMGNDFGWSGEGFDLIYGTMMSPDGVPAIAFSFRRFPKQTNNR